MRDKIRIVDFLSVLVKVNIVSQMGLFFQEESSSSVSLKKNYSFYVFMTNKNFCKLLKNPLEDYFTVSSISRQNHIGK